MEVGDELSSIDDEKARLEEQIRAKRQRTELVEETAVKIELMEQVLDLFEKRYELERQLRALERQRADMESQLRSLEIEKAKFAAEYGNCGTLAELFERFG